MPKLSVIIPVYNEAATIRALIDKVEAVDIDKEIIIVDDGSGDDTYRVLRDLSYKNLKIVHHTKNRGKGSAVSTGLSQAAGEYIIVQDADLEYDPADYPKLISVLSTGQADMALGARFTEQYHGRLIPRMGNRFLTALVNLLFGVKLNDCFTCYKMLKTRAARGFNLKARSFDIEIEMLAKAIKARLRINEVPVSYLPRTYKEGKKIRIKDGLRAIFSIIKYRFSR